MQGVLADREFPNKALITWLVEENIPFYLRIKGNMDVCMGKKKFKTSAQLFSHLAPFQQQVFGMRVHVFGQPLYLAGSKNSRDELMIVVTNKNPKNAIACYLRRWEIETLFCALKSRGWRFEETHIVDQSRIEKLIALLAIGFVWAHKIGEWRAQLRPIPLKKLCNQKRPQNSFFRLGLDTLRNFLTNFKINSNLLLKYLRCIDIKPIENCPVQRSLICTVYPINHSLSFLLYNYSPYLFLIKSFDFLDA
nr:transposase [Legionella oakridgensis]